MSTSIFFNKQFIKLGDNIIPMLLTGSSNCFDCGKTLNGNGRISRDWGNHRYETNGGVMATPAEILNSVDNHLAQSIARHTREDQQYVDVVPTVQKVKDRYGWYEGFRIGSSSTSKTSAAMYRAMYSTGIKQALTVEEMLEHGVNIEVYGYFSENDKVSKAGLERRTNVYIESSEHLLGTLLDWEKYYGQTMVPSIKFASENRVERMIKKTRGKSKKAKVPIIVSSYYVVMFNDYYLVKRTRNGKHLSYLTMHAKKFINETKVNKYLKTLPIAENYKAKLVTLHAPQVIYV